MNKLIGQTHAIEFYQYGFEFQAPVLGGANPVSFRKDKKRGNIGPWSKSSRKRFRDFLLKHSIPDELNMYAVTLTIPGPVISALLAKRCFDNFCDKITRKKYPMIWRVEIQKRGQLHWHCILGADCDCAKICKMWHKSLHSVGLIGWSVEKFFDHCKRVPSEYNVHSIPDGDDVLVCYLDHIDGATKYSAKVDLIKEHTQGWLRYLLDHTTKHKQEQIPENIGKHWGKVNKAKFVESPPVSVANLNPQQYARVMRWYNRLCTPYIFHSEALFNKKRGYSWKRGQSGKSVYFSSPETLQRMIDLSRKTHPQLRSWACDPLVLKWVAYQRKQGNEVVWG